MWTVQLSLATYVDSLSVFRDIMKITNLADQLRLVLPQRLKGWEDCCVARFWWSGGSSSWVAKDIDGVDAP